MKAPGLAITAVGAVSPIGASAVETCASVRAGLCRFQEQPWYRPLTVNARWEKPEPLVASLVPGLAAGLPGRARLRELAALALRDLFSEAGLLRADLAHAALCLAVPEPDAATRTWGLDLSLGAEICQRLGLPPLPVLSVRAEGSAGALAALGDATTALQARGTPLETVIVLAADTFIDVERLRVLDEDLRVKSARATAGAIPSEGAVALLLEGAETLDRRGRRARAVVTGFATGSEPQPRTGDKESSGRGLTEALRGVLAGAPPPQWLLCDLNGDPYRAGEWGVILARLAQELGPVGRVSHPADCLGDAGAALGGILLAQAVAGFDRAYAPAGDVVAWAGAAESGLRAAVRITRPA